MESTGDFASQAIKEEPSSPVAIETASMKGDYPTCEVKSEKKETPQKDSTLCLGVPPCFTEEIKTEELDLPAVYKEKEETLPSHYPSQLAPKAEGNFKHELRTDDDESSVYLVDPQPEGKIVTNKLTTKALVQLSERIDHVQGGNVFERNLQQSQSPLLKEHQQSGRLETQTANANIIGRPYGASDAADLYKISQMQRFDNKISKSFVQLGQRIDQPTKDKNLKTFKSKSCSGSDEGGESQTKETCKQFNCGKKAQKLEKGSNLKKGFDALTSKKPTQNKIIFSCKHCTKSFPCRSKMESHQLTHTVERPYCCKHCKKSYSTKKILERHSHITSGERYFWEHCKISFTRKDSLKMHKRFHTDEGPYYSCDHCNKIFSHNSTLAEHIRTHTKLRPYSCDHCNKSFSYKSTLATHIRTHTKKKPYSCDHCNKSFSYKSTLAAHIRTHTQERSYSCDHCNKSFSYKYILAVHIRTHTKERPYSCDQCNKSFSHKSTLTAHIRTHTKERPYSCDHCNKSFSYNSTLVTHIRTHTKERPYSCDHCNKSFSLKHNLVAHIRTHTKERPYSCDHCKKSFSRNYHLVTHIRTHTNDKAYSCVHCKKSFSTNYALKRHLQTHACQNLA